MCLVTLIRTIVSAAKENILVFTALLHLFSSVLLHHRSLIFNLVTSFHYIMLCLHILLLRCHIMVMWQLWRKKCLSHNIHKTGGTFIAHVFSTLELNAQNMNCKFRKLQTSSKEPKWSVFKKHCETYSDSKAE